MADTVSLPQRSDSMTSADAVDRLLDILAERLVAEYLADMAELESPAPAQDTVTHDNLTRPTRGQLQPV